jgi:restriction endonuclease
MWEEAAYKEGLTVEQYRNKLALEQENARLKEAEEARAAQEGAEKIYAQWLSDADALKQKYGIDFDFATELDTNKDVAVYVKLPDGFYISTPVGHYNPDWAIAFYEGTVKHIYFIAETKGSMNSMQLRMIEDAKIHWQRFIVQESILKLFQMRTWFMTL